MMSYIPIGAGGDIKVGYFGNSGAAISSPTFSPSLLNNGVSVSIASGYINIVFLVDRTGFNGTVDASFIDTDTLGITNSTFYNDNNNENNVIAWTGQFSGKTNANNGSYDATFTFNYGGESIVVVVPIVLSLPITIEIRVQATGIGNYTPASPSVLTGSIIGNILPLFTEDGNAIAGDITRVGYYIGPPLAAQDIQISGVVSDFVTPFTTTGAGYAYNGTDLLITIPVDFTDPA